MSTDVSYVSQGGVVGDEETHPQTPNRLNVFISHREGRVLTLDPRRLGSPLGLLAIVLLLQVSKIAPADLLAHGDEDFGSSPGDCPPRPVDVLLP